MAPRRHGRGYGKNRHNSKRDRKRSPASPSSPPPASLRDDSTTFIIDDDREANPRYFSYTVKQQCWDKAEKVKGRDPDRWRRDALGNIVFKKLVGCPGCLCHDYDHILPHSKVLLFPFSFFFHRLPTSLCSFHYYFSLATYAIRDPRWAE